MFSCWTDNKQGERGELEIWDDWDKQLKKSMENRKQISYGKKIFQFTDMKMKNFIAHIGAGNDQYGLYFLSQ